jgi:hypothetical protein
MKRTKREKNRKICLSTDRMHLQDDELGQVAEHRRQGHADAGEGGEAQRCDAACRRAEDGDCLPGVAVGAFGGREPVCRDASWTG